jgi:hypothetical protein
MMQFIIAFPNIKTIYYITSYNFLYIKCGFLLPAQIYQNLLYECGNKREKMVSNKCDMQTLLTYGSGFNGIDCSLRDPQRICSDLFSSGGQSVQLSKCMNQKTQGKDLIWGHLNQPHRKT